MRAAGRGSPASERCAAVLIAGDLNHALPSQLLPAGVAPTGPAPGASPSTYQAPWLPADANLEDLLEALRLRGEAKVERLSTDTPTNEDGSLDHVIVVTAAGGGKGDKGRAPGYARVAASVVPDAEAEVSDHLMVRAVLRRA